MSFFRYRKIKTKSDIHPKYLDEKELATFQPSPFIFPSKKLNLKETPWKEIEKRMAHHTIRYRTGNFCGEEHFQGRATEYPVADDFYNEDLRERVAILYKEDFEAYKFRII